MLLRLVGGLRAVGAFAVCAGQRRDQLQSFPSRGQTRGADSADALHRLRARNVIYAPKITRAFLGTSGKTRRRLTALEFKRRRSRGRRRDGR